MTISFNLFLLIYLFKIRLFVDSIFIMVNLLADFVVRFNVAARRNAEFFYIPYSAINFKVVKLLLSYGCISMFAYDTNPSTKTLRIKIFPSFLENKPLIRGLELVSKPGLRVY
mgnify:FL=1